MDEAARAEMHPVLLLALAPERDADVADPHRLGHLRAPALLEPRAERGLAAAGLAGDEDTLDARVAEVVVLGQVRRIGRRQHGRLRAQPLDRLHEPVGVARADGDVAETDPVEGGERGAGDERPGVVGRDDPLAGADPGGGVAARRAGDPVVEVTGRERDVARLAGRAARRVDPDELVRLRAEMRPERVLGRARRPQLVLLGQRQLPRSRRARPSCRSPASFSR